MIKQLTSTQQSLISEYRSKWQKTAFSTERIDRQKATEAIKAAYDLMDLKEPEIVFCNSPKEVLRLTLPHLEAQLQKTTEYLPQYLPWDEIGNRIETALDQQIESELLSELRERTYRVLLNQAINLTYAPLWDQLEKILSTKLGQQFPQISDKISGQGFIYFHHIPSEVWACDCSWFDYCISVLNCSYPKHEWQLVQALAEHCGWMFAYRERVFICDRPTKLSFDSESRLHGEGEPALEFADGFKIYAFGGIEIPPKYGKVHPHNWQAQWLLEEENAALKRVLIEGIGYSRLCQEIEAINLDSWREYSLLKVTREVDIEPIYILKMICPSTNHIHALRVPPYLHSAREAIRWINWEVDPEEFSVQT